MIRSLSAFAVAAVLWIAAASAHAQAKLEKIYVGVAGLSGALAHAFIPKDSGLYEHYGLDVELIFFRAAPRQSNRPWRAACRWLSQPARRSSARGSPVPT